LPAQVSGGFQHMLVNINILAQALKYALPLVLVSQREQGTGNSNPREAFFLPHPYLGFSPLARQSLRRRSASVILSGGVFWVFLENASKARRM
jgi:hypothetical protein